MAENPVVQLPAGTYNPVNKRMIYVGGIGDDIDQKILRSTFIPFGNIVEITIPLDYQTDKHRGYAFVEFEEAEDAAAAVDNMNDNELFGRTLRVNIARPIRIREGYGRAIWSDDNWLKKYAGKADELKSTESKITPYEVNPEESNDADEKEVKIDEEKMDGVEVTADEKHSSKTINSKSNTDSNPRVYLNISLPNGESGRLVCELRADVAPKTVENFRVLCTGEKGFGYKRCAMHRIIPEFMCQGGDFTRGDGSGGKSIYGKKFADESFKLRHDSPGILSMANCGRDTNGSQFFICFTPQPQLDKKHVVFGKVVQGIALLQKIESFGTKSGKPKGKITITDCGEF